VFANYALTRNIALQGGLELHGLQGGASDGPIVSRRGDFDQILFLLSATCAFTWWRRLVVRFQSIIRSDGII